MNLYRLSGRMELYKGCGMVMVGAAVDSSLSSLKRTTTACIKQADKEHLQYKLRIDRLWIKPITKEIIIQCLSDDNAMHMIESVERLNEYSNPTPK